MAIYLFEFPDQMSAYDFVKTVNRIITDYGCTTFGHLKQYYGVPQDSIKDIDYCKYIEKPARTERHVTNAAYYGKRIIRRDTEDIKNVYYAVVFVTFNRYDKEGQDQYPNYDEEGNLIKKESYINNVNGVQYLAAAIIERTAIDMRDNRNQGCWESEWFKELLHNDDLDPLKLRDKINYNRRTYGSWKVPDEEETGHRNSRNRTVLFNESSSDYYDYPIQHNHRST